MTTRKFRPSRGEYIFRLCFAIFGLALLAFALFWRGVPTGPAFAELVLVGGGFLGYWLISSLRALLRGDHS